MVREANRPGGKSEPWHAVSRRPPRARIYSQTSSILIADPGMAFRPRNKPARRRRTPKEFAKRLWAKPQDDIRSEYRPTSSAFGEPLSFLPRQPRQGCAGQYWPESRQQFA